MSEAETRPMTPAEFLDWEERQEFKWEFDGVRPVAMTGGTVAHDTIAGNIRTALNNRLRGTACRSGGSDLKVETGSKYRYPDAFVYCAPAIPAATVAPEPVVVFEVLSASTAAEDRTTKLSDYLSLPSVQRYIMIEQDRIFATVIARTDTGWSLNPLGPGAVLAMPEIGAEIPMDELYEGLALDRS